MSDVQCPKCHASIAAAAQFCDQCGHQFGESDDQAPNILGRLTRWLTERLPSSAGQPTTRLPSPPTVNANAAGLGRWRTCVGYRVCVHELRDEIVFDTGTIDKRWVRALRLNVEYENITNEPLKHVSLQWLLYDAEGYSYESEIRSQFYGSDAQRRLQEGMLLPNTGVRGWVAFSPATTTPVARVQFRVNYTSRHVVNFPLPPSLPADNI